MVEQMTFQTIFQFLQTVGILVGVVYYIITLRNAERSRQTQLLMQITNKYNNRDELKHYFEMNQVEFEGIDDFIDKCGVDNNPDAFVSYYQRLYLFEEIGVLVKRGLISPEVVDDVLSGVLIGFWGRYGEITKAYREIRGYPTWGEYAEYLYDVLKPLYLREHGREALRYHVKDE